MPLVSIIVPLYNKAAYVLRSLASVRAQTVTDSEIIVVDDGSTDGGADLVAEVPDPRVRLVRQVNAGPGAARNRGLAEARAPYVAFLDADDWWLPQFLKQNLASLERHPEAAAVSCGWYEYPGDKPASARWVACGIEEGVITITPETPANALVSMIAFMNPSTVLARTASVRKWGGFFEKGSRYAEDSTLWLRIFLNEALYFDPKPLVRIDVEASALCRNYRAARPVEPFLLDESILIDACPTSKLNILRRFLKMRACKTAAVMGFWGQWREARQLVRRYLAPGDWRIPLFSVAVLSSSPLVKPIGFVARMFIRR
jgi:glycosyltransferase involved in cell wall biosynthesis